MLTALAAPSDSIVRVVHIVAISRPTRMSVVIATAPPTAPLNSVSSVSGVVVRRARIQPRITAAPMATITTVNTVAAVPNITHHSHAIDAACGPAGSRIDSNARSGISSRHERPHGYYRHESARTRERVRQQ